MARVLHENIKIFHKIQVYFFVEPLINMASWEACIPLMISLCQVIVLPQALSLMKKEMPKFSKA